MEQHAGIDVSLEWSSVCIVDASGKLVRSRPCRSRFRPSSRRRSAAEFHGIWEGRARFLPAFR
jgi:hypothetical protein